MTLTAIGFPGSVDAPADARRSRFQGSTLPVVRSYGTMAVAANPNVTLGVTIGNGEAWAHGVHVISDATDSLGGFAPVTAVGTTRWDAVVLRRNWSNSTVAYVIVPGTAAANAPEVLPAGLNNSPGTLHDQVLALVQISAGQSVPTAVRSHRLRAHKTFTAPGLWALPTPPTTDLYGLPVTLENGDRYRCGFDAAGALAWLPDGGRVLEYLGANVATPKTGWALTGATAAEVGGLTRALLNPDISDVQLELSLRHSSGAALTANASGNFPNTTIATVDKKFWPDLVTPVFGQYEGAGGVGLHPFAGSINTVGEVAIQSGAPNVDLPVQTAAGTSSLRVFIRFLRRA